MRPIAFFTRPEDTGVTFKPDSTSDVLTGAPGTKDGRPAWVVTLPDGLPDGEGAALWMTRGKLVLEYHGFLRLKPGEPWAEFVPDVYVMPEEPLFH